MKKITLEQLNKIEAINGTLTTRYEYIDAIAEILDANHGGVRWNVNTMKTIALDDKHILDINTKTTKGQRFVTCMTVYDSKGIPALWLERKRGVWVCTFDTDWYSDKDNYEEVVKEMKGKPYRG